MNKYFVISCLCAIVLLYACQDILEKEITGYGVILLTPPDSHVTAANQIQFRWEAIPGAVGYRIQIVEPDFDNTVRYLHDSLVSTHIFTTALDPGVYHWRVRGENPNSTTSYYHRSITVTGSGSLEELTPQLLAPEPNLFTADEELHFNWQPLTGAEDYRFELRIGDQAGSLVNAQVVNGTSLTLADVAEGLHTWGIQAQSANSVSNFSYRQFTVDRTPPSVPVLVAPTHGALLPDGLIQFQWQSGNDANPSGIDSLFITNSNDQLIREVAVSTASYQDSLGVGTYFWYVLSRDAAGNGTFSDERVFSVQ
jgi:hypothetical protein